MAARKGIITFGLVSVPVELHVAARPVTLDFDMLHARDQGRIQYKLWCAAEDHEVPRKETVKGYKVGEQYVIMDDEDFEKAERATSRAIEVVQFVSLSEVDPVYLETSYWVGPQADAGRAYSVLQMAMAKAGKGAVVTFVGGRRQHYALLRPDGDRLALHTLYHGDEVRDFEVSGRGAQPDPREIELAGQFIEALTKPFDPEKYRDEYRETLLGIIRAKAEGQEIELPAAPAPAPKVANLMEALRASVEHVRKPLARAEAPAAEAKRPGRRPAARTARARGRKKAA
jgi:DNA end-binding protein Ku